MALRIFVGWDPREQVAFDVAANSIRRHASRPVEIIPLKLDRLRRAQIIWRRMEMRDGRIWDCLSKAYCSTEFSISRFATPILAHSGWSLFVDPDVLFTADVAELFELADDRYAVMCVKHAPIEENGIKMDGQAQQLYLRKGWSSLVLYNSDHPSNENLTLGVLNNTPGRDLHALKWLFDSEIGELPAEWNYLIGVQPKPETLPKVCHFTLGTPDMAGHEDCEYADLWRAERAMIV